MQAETITVDGVEYRVKIVYPTRMIEFEIVEGDNTGRSLSFREIRDIGGTKYNYRMSIKADRRYPEDFDGLFYALSAPVDFHRVQMPFGQKSLEFDALVRSGSAIDRGMSAGKRRWDELEILFEAIEPQRRAEDES